MVEGHRSFSAEERFAAVTRIGLSGDAEAVARELGVPVRDLRRWQRDVERATCPSSEELKRLIDAWAADLGYVSDLNFAFDFLGPAGAKSYRPDGVWFKGNIDENGAFAIFEVDDGPSPKHRAGGAALANAAALKQQRRLYFFAIAPPEHERVATTSVRVLEQYLGDKWMLVATVIASFDPIRVREVVARTLGAS